MKSVDKALAQQIRIRKLWLKRTQDVLKSNRYNGIPLGAYNLNQLKQIYHKTKATAL